jgi:hypothetical protein
MDEEQKKRDKDLKESRAAKIEELVKVKEARTEAKNRVKEAESKFRKTNAEKDVIIQQ